MIRTRTVCQLFSFSAIDAMENSSQQSENNSSIPGGRRIRLVHQYIVSIKSLCLKFRAAHTSHIGNPLRLMIVQYWLLLKVIQSRREAISPLKVCLQVINTGGGMVRGAIVRLGIEGRISYVLLKPVGYAISSVRLIRRRRPHKISLFWGNQIRWKIV